MQLEQCSTIFFTHGILNNVLQHTSTTNVNNARHGYFEVFALVLMRTIAVRYARSLKEHLEILQLCLSIDHSSFLINNKDEKLCSHKNVG